MEKEPIANVIIALLLCVFVVSGCQKKHSIKAISCEIQSVFNEYPDSSFFMDITAMCYQDEKLYLFDRKRGDVAVKSLADQSFYTVGRIGQGPSEVTDPVTFTVDENGRVIILDGGSLCAKIFEGKDFVTSLDIPRGGDTHFFTYNDVIYLTLPTDTTCYVHQSFSWKRGSMEGIKLCGTPLRITESEDMNLVRNARHLVKGDQSLYAVCPSFPIIEKYDLLSGNLLESFDLSKTEYLNEVCDYVKKEEEKSPKSFYIFLQDVCYYNKQLYLLYADWQNGYTVNKILVLSDNKNLSPVCIYQLPGKIYTSFTIGKNEIYAFNHDNAEVQTLNLTTH